MYCLFRMEIMFNFSGTNIISIWGKWLSGSTGKTKVTNQPFQHSSESNNLDILNTEFVCIYFKYSGSLLTLFWWSWGRWRLAPLTSWLTATSCLTRSAAPPAPSTTTWSSSSRVWRRTQSTWSSSVTSRTSWRSSTRTPLRLDQELKRWADTLWSL